MGSSRRNRRLSFLALGCPFMVALASAFSACGGESSREAKAKEQASALDSRPPVKPLASPVNLDGASWKLVEAPEVLRGQTAVALDNGKILVAGGKMQTDEGRTTDEAYLFDPAMKAWTPLPRMKDSRALHFALKLRNDGRVLVGGGEKFESQNYEWLATSELFDPATTTWTQTPNLAFSQLNPAITQFLDGRVLLTGGSTIDSSGPTHAAQFFDPKSAPAGRWVESDWLPAERENHAVALLQDGTVLVMGGRSSWELATQTVFAYNPGGVALWRERPHLLTGRANHTATVLEDGRVLVVGGIETVYFDDTYFDLIPTANVEIHDPSGQNEASEAASLGIGRSHHAAALLPDGRVIVVGGMGHNGPLDITEIFDPATGEWSPGPNLNLPRHDHSLIATPGRLVVFGGYAESSVSSFVESVEILEFGARLGDPCTAFAECLSGYCIEGVCCDTDCGGICVACTAARKGHGTDGTCEPVAKGTNPREECRDDGAASCGTTGTCDGKGACAVYEDGTDCGDGKVCEAGQCGGGFCGEQADGTPCGEADDCTFGLCRDRKCVPIHKLDGTRCEGGICVAGECKADRTRTPGGGNGGDGGSDDGGSLPAPAGSPSNVGDEGGGGLCSAAPGPPKQIPMAVALALLAGLGAHRRRGERH